MTYAFMGLLVFLIAATTLWGIWYSSDKNSFMTIDDTTFLRGFWCIIVVLVHVPAEYQNRIQDMLGSFAYIGVTFFFMTSAYGLKWSMDHKSGYMDRFWLRRLPPILIPAIIANAFEVSMKALNGNELSPLSYVNINGWVKVLLLYYLIFWLVYKILPMWIRGKKWQDAVMCLIVVSFSLIDYFTDFKITLKWTVEPLGFAYGILAAKYAGKIREAIGKNWLAKSICLMLLAGATGVAYLKFKPVHVWGDYLLKIVLGIAITAFMYELITKLKVGNKANAFLGRISYEVYILHRGVFALMIAVFGYTMDSGLFVVASVAVTLILAILLKKLCEPLIKRVQTLGSKE